MIRLFAEVVEQPLQQPRRDCAAGDPDRSFDGLLELLAGHPRDQVFAAVHRLGEFLELGAVADEIRAHRQHDVDGQLLLGGGMEEHADEFIGRFALGFADLVEAEDLLELIHHEEEVHTVAQPGLPDGFDEADVTPVEGGHEPGLGVLLSGVVEVRFEQRFREMTQRGRPRMGDGDFPYRSRLDHPAAEQVGEQAAADEGRLAAAGGADHGDKPVRGQRPEQVHGLLFAAEEEVILLRRERSQAGEGIVGAMGLGHGVGSLVGTW